MSRVKSVVQQSTVNTRTAVTFATELNVADGWLGAAVIYPSDDKVFGDLVGGRGINRMIHETPVATLHADGQRLVKGNGCGFTVIATLDLDIVLSPTLEKRLRTDD